MIFNDFEVFVPREPRLKFPFLLSATLLYGIEYTIDTINGNFIVRMNDNQNLEREFKIKDIHGKLYPQIDGILIQDIEYFFSRFLDYINFSAKLFSLRKVGDFFLQNFTK